jgi:hypothetical protein
MKKLKSHESAEGAPVPFLDQYALHSNRTDLIRVRTTRPSMRGDYVPITDHPAGSLFALPLDKLMRVYIFEEPKGRKQSYAYYDMCWEESTVPGMHARPTLTVLNENRVENGRTRAKIEGVPCNYMKSVLPEDALSGPTGLTLDDVPLEEGYNEAGLRELTLVADIFTALSQFQAEHGGHTISSLGAAALEDPDL